MLFLLKTCPTVKPKPETWELVSFISAEAGDDLVVSFAVYQPDDPADVKTLTILRVPNHEWLLFEWERGAAVSFDRDPVSDERVLLREVVYSPEDGSIVLRTDHRRYGLDVQKVDPEELTAMREVFRKMNFDSSFLLTGV